MKRLIFCLLLVPLFFYSAKSEIVINPLSDELLLGRKANIVEANGEWTTFSTTGGLGFTASNRWREYFQKHHLRRIRQEGDVVKVELVIAASGGVDAVFVRWWTYDGTGNNFTCTGMTQDLLPDLTIGVATQVNITSLTNNANLGDLISILIHTDGISNSSCIVLPAIPESAIYLVAGTTDQADITAVGSSFDWGSPTSGFSLEVRVFMQAPHFALIGASHIAGHNQNSNFTFFEDRAHAGTLTEFTPDSTTIPSRINELKGYVYQNFAKGGLTLKSIVETDQYGVQTPLEWALATFPSVLIVAGGTHDLNTPEAPADSTTILDQILTNLEIISDSCEVYGIPLIYNGFLPRVYDGNHYRKADQADVFSVWVRNVFAKDKNFIFVDMGPLMGKFLASSLACCSGGEAQRNLWRLADRVDSGDGAHPSRLGYSEWGDEIVRLLEQSGN